MQVKHTGEEKMVQGDILKLLGICIKVFVTCIISTYQVWVPQTQSEGAPRAYTPQTETSLLPAQLTGAF